MVPPQASKVWISSVIVPVAAMLSKYPSLLHQQPQTTRLNAPAGYKRRPLDALTASPANLSLPDCPASSAVKLSMECWYRVLAAAT